jgi:hypothetical protein
MTAYGTLSAPNLWNAVRSSSALSNGKGKLKPGYWSARVRPTAQQSEFESIKTSSVNAEIGRRNKVQVLRTPEVEYGQHPESKQATNQKAIPASVVGQISTCTVEP